MAKIEVRPDLIAERYSRLPVHPNLIYTFEQQDTIPVDNGNPFFRQLSPFTLSYVPPEVITPTGSGYNVSLLAKAGRETEEYQQYAQEYRKSFGVGNMAGSTTQVLNKLQQILAKGATLVNARSERERSVIVDGYTAADIAYQVQAMLEAPTLTLLVNPSSFSLSYTDIQQYGDAGRFGKNFQRWGTEQLDISISGSTGAYVTAPFNNTSDTITGCQWASRRNSAAYQNFVSLLHMFKNNGLIFDTINKTETNLMVGAIAINYDQMTYIGHIESFDYSFAQDKPTNLEWSMSFKADRVYDNHTQSTYIGPPRSLGSGSQTRGGISNQRAFSGQGTQQVLGNTPLDIFIPKGR